MFYLFYKFFKESLSLMDYNLSFYLSNIVIITFLQCLFFIFVYNFCKQLKIKITEYTKKYSIHDNTKLIKNVLITYHEEQIKFITKLFDNELVQQLFSNNAHNNNDNNDKHKLNIISEISEISDTNETCEVGEINQPNDKNNITDNTITSTENNNPNTAIASTLINFFQFFCKKRETSNEHASTNVKNVRHFEKKNKYPALPESPKQMTVKK